MLSKRRRKMNRYVEIFLVALRLGFTSFGGPVAHLGYFREEYINRRKWLDEKSYADLIALCQFLPGPASSQVGISIGMVRGGILGGFLAWLGFTMPSVIALIVFALVVTNVGGVDAGWIHGLKLVAVAVVTQAILGMGKKLTPDRERITIAIVGAVATLAFPTAWGQIGIILAAAIIGYILYRNEEKEEMIVLPITFSKKLGIAAWVLFFGLLFSLPLLRNVFDSVAFAIFDIFYRVGSLVFGGGHVVLPMLERELVPAGFLSEESFLAGYGAAQGVPGPLFTLSGYIGAAIGSWPLALIAVAAIFLPSFLLLIGTLPFWNSIREMSFAQGALKGVNAVVVGILLAALYDPVFTSAVQTPADFAVVVIAFGLAQFWKVPAWLIVIGTAVAGAIISII
ncbi:ChrA protein [Bacillus coahuilensis p1.1.43]|uniref:ChrA protein n=2 Tax=Bacillus coahuilensis TaxID=408580 RepID=A0A147KAV7_9BACI|nr:ChrA protein [Bacillus coahuilensis p1.1.43]